MNQIIRGLFILFLCLPMTGFAQNVTNIKTSQIDSRIKIEFDVENSTEDELLTISIKCIVNDKYKIDVDSATGDIGYNIWGGKARYTVFWDVLSQVDELNSAEFIIRVEKQSFYKATEADLSHPFFVSYNLGALYTQVGGQIGFLKKWGGFVAVRYSTNGTYNVGNGPQKTDLYSYTAGITKLVFASDQQALHVYVAGGMAKWGTYSEVEYDPNDPFNSKSFSGDDMEGTEVEIGGLLQHRRWLFGMGFGINSGEYGSSVDLIANIGYRF